MEEKYPYFIYPILEELKNCVDPVKASKLKERIAANVGEKEALIALIGHKEADLRDFYSDDATPVLSTDDTIDSFLSRFGGASQFPPLDSPLFASLGEEPEEPVEEKDDEYVKDEPVEEPEEPIVEEEPVIEENEDLEEEEPPVEDGPMEEPEASEEPEQESDAIVEELPVNGELVEEESIEEEPEEEESVEEEPVEVQASVEETSSSENTLEMVKKLVKNHEYKEALEILESIYLNNPKKSVYFADQIRFIKKMMLNESKK